MTSQLKTFMLFALLSGLLIVIGGALGGRAGIIIALAIAVVTNVASYWYSDTLVLRMYNAQELLYEDAPQLSDMMEELSANAGVPKPRFYIIPEDAPNAFATGRDPEHSAIAVTEGLLSILSPEEIEGVLAHEMAHIAHRDILIQTVAAVMGSAITSVAHILQFSAFWGGGNNEDRPNPLVSILLAILAPLAAMLIQMAISRSREYLADEGGASYCGNPRYLASALNKLGQASGAIPMRSGSPATSEMFIVAPLFGGGMENLFSTHPPIEERIARLSRMGRR